MSGKRKGKVLKWFCDKNVCSGDGKRSCQSFFGERSKKSRSQLVKIDQEGLKSCFALGNGAVAASVGSQEVVDRADISSKKPKSSCKIQPKMTVSLYHCKHSNS